MNVQAVKNRTRAVSPISSHSPGATRSQTLARQEDQGLVYINNITVPAQVDTGQGFTVRGEVKNDALIVAGDANECGPILIPGGDGLRVRAMLIVDGNVLKERSSCVTGGGGTHEFSFNVSFAEPGQKNVGIRIEMAVTEEFVGEQTETVNVSGDSTDCPGNLVRDPLSGLCVEPDDVPGGGPWLPCFLDPNRQCAGPENFAWMLVLILILLVAAGAVT